MLKKITFDDLYARLKTYLKTCAEIDRYTLDLTTWLNPEKEHWKDVMVSNKVEKSKQVSTIRFKTQ